MIIRGSEPVFIIRKTESGTDAYGNPTYTTQEILVRDALFAFTETNEPNSVSEDPTMTRLNLYFPHGTEVRDGDKFEIRETIWEKDGTPMDWQIVWPGFSPGVVVRVKRVNG